MIKQFRNILIFCKEALSVSQGPVKVAVSVLFVLSGSLFYFNQVYVSYLAALMFTAWLFLRVSPGLFFRSYLNSGIWLFLLVYMAYAVSILYSENMAESQKLMDTKLLLPILPLLLVKQWRPSGKLTHLMFIVLSITFVAMLSSLWMGIYQIYEADNNPDYWRNYQSWFLNRRFGLHHGDYSLIGLLIIMHFATRIYENKSRIWLWIPLVLFWILIFYTGSDIARVVSVVFVGVFFLDRIWKRFRTIFPYLYIASLILILFIPLFVAECERFENNSNDRIMIWPVSMELIKEKPLFGYGIGDTDEVLMEKYQEYGFERPLTLKLNSHNQYLDIWLASGLMGLLALISLLVHTSFIASRKNNLQLIFFLIAITLVFSVENLLSRFDGVFILSFFYTSFRFNSKQK